MSDPALRTNGAVRSGKKKIVVKRVVKRRGKSTKQRERPTGWRGLRDTKVLRSKDGKWEEKHPLLKYARAGEVEKITKLTGKKDWNVNYQDKYTKATALEYAISEGHIECARVLLNLGANCNLPFFDGKRSTLSSAAARNDVKLLDSLAAAGANFGIIPVTDPPINRACWFLAGHSVEWLLRQGASAKQLTTENASTVLITCIGSSCGAWKKEGWTPGQDAEVRVALLQLLLEHGADASVQGPMGWNMAMASARAGPMEAMFLAKRKQVSFAVTDTQGWTPLHMVAEHGPAHAMRWLLEHCGPWAMDAKLLTGHTALHLVTRSASVEKLALMLIHGASPDSQLSAKAQYLTSLYLAMLSANPLSPVLVRLLLLAGAQTHIKCGRFKSALKAMGYECPSEQREIKKRLLEGGATLRDGTLERQKKKGGWYSVRLIACTHALKVESHKGHLRVIPWGSVASVERKTTVDRTHGLLIVEAVSKSKSRNIILACKTPQLQDEWLELLSDGKARTKISLGLIQQVVDSVAVFSAEGKRLTDSAPRDWLADLEASLSDIPQSPPASTLPTLDLADTGRLTSSDLMALASPGRERVSPRGSSSPLQMSRGDMCAQQCGREQALQCSECNEGNCGKEMCGNWYRLKSLGETEKRFLCSKCSEVMKRKAKAAALDAQGQQAVKSARMPRPDGDYVLHRRVSDGELGSPLAAAGGHQQLRREDSELCPMCEARMPEQQCTVCYRRICAKRVCGSWRQSGFACRECTADIASHHQATAELAQQQQEQQQQHQSAEAAATTTLNSAKKDTTEMWVVAQKTLPASTQRKPEDVIPAPVLVAPVGTVILARRKGKGIWWGVIQGTGVQGHFNRKRVARCTPDGVPLRNKKASSTTKTGTKQKSATVAVRRKSPRRQVSPRRKKSQQQHHHQQSPRRTPVAAVVSEEQTTPIKSPLRSALSPAKDSPTAKTVQEVSSDDEEESSSSTE